jgi:hypothetical protein
VAAGGLLLTLAAAEPASAGVIRLVGYETGDLTEGEPSCGSCSLESTTVRSGSGSYSMKVQGGTDLFPIGTLPVMPACSIRVSFYKKANPGSDLWILRFYSTPASSTQFDVLLTSTGTLKVAQTASLGLTTTTGSTALANNTWYTIRVVYDAAANGVLQVFLDSSTEINVTHSSLGSDFDQLNVNGLVAPNEYFFDDVYVADTATQPPLGQIVRKAPMGAGNLTEFDSTTGSATHWQNVDDVVPLDTDYNQHAAATSATDLYALEDAATAPVIASNARINAVKAMWRLKNGTGNSSGGTHDYAYRENATNSSVSVATTTFTMFNTIWATAPNSGGAWTATILDALELGAKHNGTQAQDTYISWTAAMVDYHVRRLLIIE